jgi:MFS family permease
MAKIPVVEASPEDLTASEPPPKSHKPLQVVHVTVTIFLLFLNYFLAQFDKFVLSYFQTEVVESLALTSTQYGILSGYAVGIAYALFALPVAFVADYTRARVWVLTIAAAWWSICVVFQGLSHNFWQILLARIGMGIGQAPVEALGISLISDLVPPEWLFVCERYVDPFQVHSRSSNPSAASSM